jgi:hypothetical protein
MNHGESGHTPNTPQTIESLWPQVFRPTKSKAPAAILKEQATILGQSTRYIVRADVGASQNFDYTFLCYEFILVAPALSNYALSLFSITHKAVELYPVTIYSEFLDLPGNRFVRIILKSENAFRLQLKIIFAHQKVVDAIESLLAQSEGYIPPN